jgi:hypothetical protein
VGSISLCNTPARPRVQRAPGLPHALYVSRANEMQNFGRYAPREREVVCASSVIPGRRNAANYGAQLRT